MSRERKSILEKLNNEFIDLPVVEKYKQNTPSFSAEVMTGLVRWKTLRERMIFVLCIAAGPRLANSWRAAQQYLISVLGRLRIRDSSRLRRIQHQRPA